MGGVWKAVRVYDPAIDLETRKDDGELVTDLRAYVETRDAKHLRFRDGAQPVWFYLRPMRMGDKRDYVDLATSDGEKYLRAFEVTIERVSGPGIGDVSARRSAKRAEVQKLDEGELDRMAAAGLGAACFADIGSAAYWRATLPLDCSGGFQVPPSSLHALVAATRNSPFAAPRSQPSQSSAPLEAAQTPIPETPSASVARGASAGDATAILSTAPPTSAT